MVGREPTAWETMRQIPTDRNEPPTPWEWWGASTSAEATMNQPGPVAPIIAIVCFDLPESQDEDLIERTQGTSLEAMR